MDGKPDSLAIIQSPAAMRRWCILAALALAPLPAFHALPEGFLYYLFESPKGWPRLSQGELNVFPFMGLPMAPIFLAWALPSAHHPGLPKRTIAALWFLVAYNPTRYYFEKHLFGDTVARIATFDEVWSAGWIVRHIDTPLLIGLAYFALTLRPQIRPIAKVSYHWILFVCAIWAAGTPLFDAMFYRLPWY